MTQRAGPVIGSVVFLFLAPGTVAGLVPWMLTGWRPGPAFLGLDATRWLGAPLLALGVVLILEAFARFAWQGRGTPAPVYPTQVLVVTGSYRFVRNPMYVAVTALILGQALILARPGLLAYGLAIWAAFHAFVLAYEEPTLKRTFGDSYQAYRAAVRRWIPRLTPWTPDAADPRLSAYRGDSAPSS